MDREHAIRKVRETLQRRRRDLLNAHGAVQGELRALSAQERDPEYEESAQSELADYTLYRLMESQRRELQMIDAALERIADETFGVCVDCGKPIASDRLEALPFAIRCEEDARHLEQEQQARAVPGV
jgi:DnaK suppressor protein